MQETLSVSPAPAVAETSIRYEGWRVIFACFVVATFAWGIGFYGHGVYLAELQRTRGWPTSLMSTATTVYYFTGSMLVIYVADIMQKLGPRLMLAAGACCFSLALVGLAFIQEPWQLFAVYLVMATGWMFASAGALTNVAGLWFFQKRGLAISLALTGASFGGIVITPAMVAAVTYWGFTDAMLGAAVVTLVVMVATIGLCIGRPPALIRKNADTAGSPLSTDPWTRGQALRSLQFWTMTMPFALGIGAQVGFLVHQIAFLMPKIGGLQAASYAVAVTTVLAIVGRLAVGMVIDKLNQRVISAASFTSQAVALLIMMNTDNAAVLYLACALFGFSVGNLITLPSLIIFREFSATSFGMLVGLSVAINGVIYAFGPGAVGWLRDFSGTYTASFTMCIGLQLLAAVIILIPFRSRVDPVPSA